MVLEHERTFLAKCIPEGLERCQKKEIADTFIPTVAHHPVLRIRKNGDRFEMTKKYPVKEGDASVQHELTIPLTKKEYDELVASVKGKRARKVRHIYERDRVRFEVDVYQDALKGLVVVDAEFPDGVGKDDLKMPDFCLADVTQETAFAGGMLVGKSYADIEPTLRKYHYKKL